MFLCFKNPSNSVFRKRTWKLFIHQQVARTRFDFGVQVPHVTVLAKNGRRGIGLVMPDDDRRYLCAVRNVHHSENALQVTDGVTDGKCTFEVLALYIDDDQCSAHINHFGKNVLVERSLSSLAFDELNHGFKSVAASDERSLV